MEVIKKLGFGLMRLPQIGQDIDIEETARMADLFLERGFRYFDTAYLYNGSEEAFREAVVKRHNRDDFMIASKLPLRSAQKPEDMDRIFNTSLERCGIEYFDFYLLHGLKGDEAEQKRFAEMDAWNWLFNKKAEGKIRHAGFSYHGGPEDLDKLLTAHPEVEFVQLQINYVDWDDKQVQSRLNWETARRHGKNVIVMEPVKGGALATMSEDIRSILTDSEPESSAASWAVRFAASLDGVMVVLSGMSTYEQVKDNTAYMQELKPITDEELKLIGKVRAALAQIPTIPCTSCRYCVDDCPMHISIPSIISAYNGYKVYGNVAAQKRRYGQATSSGGKASDCVGCRNCEERCPQGIQITEHLRSAAEIFE